MQCDPTSTIRDLLVETFVFKTRNALKTRQDSGNRAKDSMTFHLRDLIAVTAPCLFNILTDDNSSTE